MESKKISIVVPSYNEEEALPIFYETTEDILKKQLPEVEVEYLFIDDGSRDNTLEVIHHLNEQDSRVHYVSFSRNFGKEAAIYAGLENASGDYVVIMDSDLQDPPALLPAMYQSITSEGYDCIGSRRVTRAGEPPIRSFFARKFYRIMDKISDSEIVDGARDFQMMNRKVVNAILSMGEYNRFSKGIFGWVGYRKKWLEYENVERSAGETKWSFWSLFLYAIDGMIAFSTKPLIISSLIGIFFCFVAFITIIVIIVKTLIFGDPTSGWPSMICILMLVSGVQLLSIGILGEYTAKTYLETKKRPLYLIEEAKLATKEIR